MEVRLEILVVASTDVPVALSVPTVKLEVEALVAESLEIVVVAKVEVPITVSVPDAFNDEVAVITPPVIDEEKIEVIKEVAALSIVAKRLEVEALVAAKVVAVALVNTDEEPFRLENVPVLLVRVLIFPVLLFRLVIVPEAEVRLVVDAIMAERLEIVVVAKVLTPNHVLLAFIIPKVDDA